MNLFLENSPIVHLQGTQVNQIGLSNGAITKHPGQSDLSLQWCIYKAPRAIRLVSPMVQLQSTQGNQICLPNGAFTHAPDLSLQWCIYKAPRAIRFVSPMVHLHMHLFARAKKNTFSHRSARVHFLAAGQHCPLFLTSAQHPAQGWEGGAKWGPKKVLYRTRHLKTPIKCVINFAPTPQKKCGKFRTILKYEISHTK